MKKLTETMEVISIYIKYVIFGRFNKLTQRHFTFLETSNWIDSNTKQRLVNKLKKINGL